MSRMWTHPGTLAGEVVRLEPLSLGHLDGLWAASRDPRTWQWLAILQPRTRAEMQAWAEEALGGPDFAFATIVRADASDQSWGNLPVPPDPLHRSAARTDGYHRRLPGSPAARRLGGAPAVTSACAAAKSCFWCVFA